MKMIAVIDDDTYIGNMIEELLIKAGYGVMRAYSGTEAVLLLDKFRPDLILLDLMLPGLSGEEVLQKAKGIPVIIVSAKTDTNDKVKLLLDGAADYVAKPFNTKELLARIEVQFRKINAPVCSTVLTFSDLRLDTLSHSLSVCDAFVSLTKTEFAIIKLLMKNPKQVLAKSVILDEISLDTPDCTDSSLKQHISNLRHKLRNVSGKDYIEAIWGIGFRLTE